MLEISELTYTLNKGAMSRDSSYAMLAPYDQQAKDSQEKLRSWHNENMSRLKINVSSSRRRRQGLDDVVWAVPALFNDNLHYKSINGETIEMIRHQMAGTNPPTDAKGQDLYRKDVVLIKSGGVIYYLPPAGDE